MSWGPEGGGVHAHVGFRLARASELRPSLSGGRLPKCGVNVVNAPADVAVQHRRLQSAEVHQGHTQQVSAMGGRTGLAG